jgi:hypothetical protein
MIWDTIIYNKTITYMKKIVTALFLTAFITISFNTASQAQTTDGVGIGFMVGEPTGLTLKSWTGGNNAFALGVAWSLEPTDAITIQGDYLWHNFDVFDDIDSGALPLYYGIGARVILAEDDVHIGARIPVGLNYLFEDAPIGIFLEVAPIFDFAPNTEFDIDGVLGIRFYL